MHSPIEDIEILSSKFNELKNQSDLNSKCMLLLDTFRRAGWGKVTLSFLNEQYETLRTLFSGFTEKEQKLTEQHKVSPDFRKKLLGSMFKKWQLGAFFYLPWSDSQIRRILSGGMISEIPLHIKNKWHDKDLLYAPIYFKSRPVAILRLDKPRVREKPNLANLRIPNIILSVLIEVIKQYIAENNLILSQDLRQALQKQGGFGFVKISHRDKIEEMNPPAEIILNLSSRDLNYGLFKALKPALSHKLESYYRSARDNLAVKSITVDEARISRKPICFHFLPFHILGDFRYMVIILYFAEFSDIFSDYSKIIKEIHQLFDIKAKIYQDRTELLLNWLIGRYRFSFPRMYRLSADKSTLECFQTYHIPSEYPRDFFSHPHNRNSLASSALLEKQIVLSTTDKALFRDVRKIWDALETQAAIAIPLILTPGFETVLVCDFDPDIFRLSNADDIILNYFGALMGSVILPAIKP